MITLLTQAAPPPTESGGTLAVYVALGMSILGPIGAALNTWSNRKTRRERDAAIKQAEAQGGVIATGTPLEWRTTDHQALMDERLFSRELRDRADKAEEKARDLSDRLAETDRRGEALRREFDQLVARIAACEAGHFCPVADALTRNPETRDRE